MEGYKSMFNDTLVTVWSAPNYCYRCGNVAAILELDENLETNFKKFEAAPQEVRGTPGTANKKQVPDYFLWSYKKTKVFLEIYCVYYDSENPKTFIYKYKFKQIWYLHILNIQ